MTLGPVLDVAIGLAFTYLLLGLLTSGVQEMLAALVRKRSKQLAKGIRHLLQGEKGAAGEYLFEAVFNHGLVSELSPDRAPTYVPARNFAVALIDALRDGSQSPLAGQVERSIAKLPSGRLQTTLSALVERAGGDLDALQHSLEVWYDDAMDCVSGIYKRSAKRFNLILAFAVAVLLNVDSIALARTLWVDRALREVTVGLAQRYVEADAQQPAAELEERMKAVQGSLASLDLPIGWSASPSSGEFRGVPAAWTCLGWILTALAITIGAPFWFDALQGLLKLRISAPRPARAEKDGP